MTIQEYILSTVKSLQDPVPQADILEGTALADAIYAKLTSKKFRKTKVDPEAEKTTKKAIKKAIAEHKPITVSLLFGGNKLWRFDEAPEIDWAELFSLVYYLQWMKSVASVYEHGVRLDYLSQDVSVERLNNVPRAETDQYSDTFRQMLDWMRPYMPSGVEVTYRRHLEHFKDPADYITEIEAAKAVVLKENGGKLPVLTEEMKTATELNVKRIPGQDTDPQWREKVELEHQAIFYTKTLGSLLSDPDIIPACPTYYPGLLVVGSTKRSMAKFWAGVGALQPHKESFREVVLTPRQLEVADYEWHDVTINGLMGKNFSKIRVIK